MNDDLVDTILTLGRTRRSYLDKIATIYKEIDPRLKDFLDDEIDLMIQELEEIRGV